MPKLPKSVVIEGRRYPTWALSSRARDQLINLHHVDVHIAELRQRLAFYRAAYRQSQTSLSRALSEQALSDSARPAKEVSAVGQRYFWHIVPTAWGKANFPSKASALNLHAIGASGYYQEGDRLLLYVKGHGVVGWGAVEVDTSSAKPYLAMRCQAASLADALPASALKAFSLRHPNRVSQRLPENANIERLLAKLASLPAA